MFILAGIATYILATFTYTCIELPFLHSAAGIVAAAQTASRQ